MTDPRFSAELQDYLRTLPDSVALIDAVELTHSAFDAAFRLVRWGSDLSLTHEGPAGPYPYESSEFAITAPFGVGAEVASEVELTVSRPRGRLYRALAALTKEQRAERVVMVLRTYVQTDLTAPVINPPFAVDVQGVLATAEVVRITGRPPDWGSLPAGRLYRATDWPSMRDLQND